jgi:hypothetical protein
VWRDALAGADCRNEKDPRSRPSRRPAFETDIVERVVHVVLDILLARPPCSFMGHKTGQLVCYLTRTTRVLTTLDAATLDKAVEMKVNFYSKERLR